MGHSALLKSGNYDDMFLPSLSIYHILPVVTISNSLYTNGFFLLV